MTHLTQIEKVMHLRRVKLFTHCSAEQIIRLAAIAGERSFQEGDQIYVPAEPSEALFSIVSGQVTLEGTGHEPARRVSTPGTFGVQEILSGRFRSFKAIASAPTVALAIEAEDFFDLLSDNIEIVKALFRDIISDREEEPRTSSERGLRAVHDEARDGVRIST